MGKHSTARAVTAGRALAHLRGVIHDPFAQACLDPLAARDVVQRHRCLVPGSPRALLSGLLIEWTFDLVGARTAVIDEVLGGISPAGRQLVLLGAGYDARAHRLPALRDTPVFEVDLGSLQQHKRIVSAGWPILARTLAYVPGDLCGADWPTALLDQGFEPEKPTDWIAEGVCTYLRPEAIDGLLRQVSRLSHPRSRLCLTYNEDSLVRKLISHVTSAWGEPHHFFSAPHDMARRLRGEGFEVMEDTDGLERARRIRRPLRFSDRAWTRTHHVVWAHKLG